MDAQNGSDLGTFPKDTQCCTFRGETCCTRNVHKNQGECNPNVQRNKRKSLNMNQIISTFHYIDSKGRRNTMHREHENTTQCTRHRAHYTVIIEPVCTIEQSRCIIYTNDQSRWFILNHIVQFITNRMTDHIDTHRSRARSL